MPQARQVGGKAEVCVHLRRTASSLAICRQDFIQEAAGAELTSLAFRSLPLPAFWGE